METKSRLTINGRVVDKATGRQQPDALIAIFAWLSQQKRQGRYLDTIECDDEGRFNLSFTDEQLRELYEEGVTELHLTVYKGREAIGTGTHRLDSKRRTSSMEIKTLSVAGGKQTDITVEDAWVDLGTTTTGGGRPSTAGQTVQRIVSDALGDIVGARWNPQDSPQRLWGLVDRAFTAQTIGDKTAYVWNNRYSVKTAAADGPVTGEQAILADLANTTLPEMQTLLRGLTPATPARFDAVEGEAARSILGTLLSELALELNRVPPRVPKVETMLHSIRGQMGTLEGVFGFRRHAITLDQAEKRTDFDKLSLLVLQLESATERFLEAAAMPEDFGTQLIMLKRVLAAVTEVVEDTRAALVSVLISDADQQNIYLGGSDAARGVSVAGLLDWAGSLETYARTLIDEGGRRGVEVLLPNVGALKALVDLLLRDPDQVAVQHPGFRRPRVQRPIGELDSNLAEVVDRLRQLVDLEDAKPLGGGPGRGWPVSPREAGAWSETREDEAAAVGAEMSGGLEDDDDGAPASGARDGKQATGTE